MEGGKSHITLYTGSHFVTRFWFWFLLHLPISQLPFLGVTVGVAYIGDSFPIGALMTILQAVANVAQQLYMHHDPDRARDRALLRPTLDRGLVGDLLLLQRKMI